MGTKKKAVAKIKHPRIIALDAAAPTYPHTTSIYDIGADKTSKMVPVNYLKQKGGAF